MGRALDPRFDLCGRCNLHGRIVTASGIFEPEVCSKKMAERSLANALESRRVKAAHAAMLRRAIMASGLPKDGDGADRGTRHCVREWNRVRHELEQDLHPDRFHDFFEN